MVDFNVEINNHLQWRAIIESIITGQVSMHVPASLLMSDNHCQLGKWLFSSESDCYEGNYHFNLLINDHKKFHLLASEIVTAHKQGDAQRVEQLKNAFYSSSDKVINSLHELKKLEQGKSDTKLPNP